MIPGLQELFASSPVATKFTNLGQVVSLSLNIIFYIASFLAFFWLVWGAFQYIFAGGNKEGLARARSRITWAIIGLIILLLAFLVSQYVAYILQPRTGTTII